MRQVGPPIESSLLQAVTAQQQAARVRDRDRARAESPRRPAEDEVDLRIAGVEDGGIAARRLPPNNSEESAQERRDPRRKPPRPGDGNDQPHVDVTA